MSVQVLDKGHVKLLNLSGPVRRPEEEFDADEVDIAKAARISFGNRNKSREQDLKLVKFLHEHKHTSPFEMIETWWDIKAPIFIARQWMRHRTASVNEISGRYAKLPKEFYIPEVVRAKPEKGGNKQGSSGEVGEDPSSFYKEQLEAKCKESYHLYESFLGHGVCNEQARIVLHQNHYTQFLWKMDLHNLLHFLELRLASNAQQEVQEYAKAITWYLRVHLYDLMEVANVEKR